MADKGISQLGIRLREAREARGLSLAQAAAETRILQRYLVALEDGAFHYLPGDVYARGFIRNYAQYLGLPAEELIERYRDERGGTDKIRVVPAAIPPRTRSILVPSALIVMIVVTILVVGGFLILNALGLTSLQTANVVPTATRAPATPVPLPSHTPQPTLPDGSTAVPQVDPLPGTTSPSVPAAPTATPTLAAPVVVNVRISGGDSWMQISADGIPQIEGIQRDFNRIFTAQNDIFVTAGNAGVVEISFNNGPFERLGQPGEVVSRSYAAPPQ